MAKANQAKRVKPVRRGKQAQPLQAKSLRAMPAGKHGQAAMRYPAIDALRGFAMLLMIAYHFCFDLQQFHFLQQDFNHNPFWLTARAVIVSLFLVIVGISLVLSRQQGLRHFWQRAAMLALCAALVTVASMLMFPGSYIFFGILHFILVASLVGLLLFRYSRFMLVPGIAIILAGISYSHPVFDQPWLQWIGLMTHKPITEDYVPMFPWLGVVLIGMFIADYVIVRRKADWLTTWLVDGKLPKPISLLTKPGRHGLLIYMVHQPILLAGLSAWTWLFPR